MTAPLEGLKLLDFTTLLPGPFGMMLLGDLGAEVLRVGAPNRIDLLRGMIVEVPKPGGTTQKQVGSPFKFSSCKPVYRHVGVEAGRDTREVLIRAGYSEDKIEDMRAAGVFG